MPSSSRAQPRQRAAQRRHGEGRRADRKSPPAPAPPAHKTSRTAPRPRGAQGERGRGGPGGRGHRGASRGKRKAGTGKAAAPRAPAAREEGGAPPSGGGEHAGAARNFPKRAGQAAPNGRREGFVEPLFLMFLLGNISRQNSVGKIPQKWLCTALSGWIRFVYFLSKSN